MTRGLCSLALLAVLLGAGDLPAEDKPTTPAGTPPAATSSSWLADLTTGPDDARLLRVKAARSAIRAAGAKSRGAHERHLLEAARRSDLSAATRNAFAEVLEVCGSAESVPLLSGWAREAETADAAIRALGTNPSAAAERALVSLIPALPDQHKTALLDALGNRRVRAAVPALEPLLAHPQPEIASASASALGRIGTRQATDVLKRWKPTPQLEDARRWALLASGRGQIASGGARRAQKLFRELLDAGLTPAQRIAAADGLILAGGPGGLMATQALLSDLEGAVGPRLAPLWLRGAAHPEIGGSGKPMAELARIFVQLPPDTQLVLAAAAEQLGSPKALPVVRSAMNSPVPEVRLAGITALGTCANTLALAEPLLEALADPAERSAAVSALSRLKLEGLDERIQEAAKDATPEVRAALLHVGGIRIHRGIMPLVLESAAGTDRALRQAAFDAMGSLVRGEDLALLLGLRSDLRTPAERREWHEAVLNATRFRSDPDPAAELIAGHIPGAANAAERGTFAHALTLLDGPKADEQLHQLLAHPDLERRKEIIRALSSARNPKAAGLLIEVAEKAADSSERILALRGHLDALDFITTPNSEKVLTYQRAWKAAERDEERLAVISGVDKLWGDEASKFSQELHRLMPSAPPPPSWLLP